MNPESTTQAPNRTGLADAKINARETPSPALIRRKGFFRFLMGFGVFAVGLTIPMYVLPYLGHQLTPMGMIPLAIPGAYALAGLLEVITGVSFLECARRWDELKGWQRGVFGTTIVIVAIFVIVVVVGLIASGL
jgi:hypothetical protein